MYTGRSSWKTPIQYLGDEDFFGSRVYVKRDDLIPLSFGGNKARKALLFFREIERLGCDCIVTYGSSSSNHCRVVSNLAASKRMQCFIIQPREASQETFNSRLIDMFGAEVTSVPAADVHDAIEDKLEGLARQGRRPYFIPGGGHGNIGTSAYVNCYEEIKEYEAREKVYFDEIFLASGTGTTQAGLICGQMMHGDERKIIGISIARKNPRGKEKVVESVEEFMGEKGLGINHDMIEEHTIFVDDYVGHGYGCRSEAVDGAIRDAMIDHGIPMDSTYVGKAFDGMKRILGNQPVKGENILFIHTGGTPLFFDDLGRWGGNALSRPALVRAA